MGPDEAVPSLAEVTALVLGAEAEHGLMGLRVDDAPLWQRIRFDVHRRLLVAAGTMGPPEPVSSTFRSRLVSRARTVRASVRSSAFSSSPRCDVLFAGSGRRVHEAELGWYAPCCGLVAGACGLRSLVVEFYLGRWGAAAPRVPTRYLDRLHLSSLPGRLLGHLPALPAHVRTVLADVAAFLRSRTGVSLDLASMARCDLAARSHDLPRYARLLERCGARVVVVECSYDKHSLIEAAQAMSLPVVELQHGVMSRHHLGYHFPRSGGRPQLVPDWFLAWGEYWRSAADLPTPWERVLPVGFPRFDRNRTPARSGKSPSDSGDVLFLSQAMLGERLSRFAADLARQGLRDRIVFRLHPREEDGWQIRYPWLRESGVRVCGSETPLYAQLSAAPIHVGTFSTALFEGLALGARLYLVPAPGIEYMDDLLRKGLAALARAPEELAVRLRAAAEVPAPPPSDDLFRPGALARACAVIRMLAMDGVPSEASPR